MPNIATVNFCAFFKANACRVLESGHDRLVITYFATEKSVKVSRIARIKSAGGFKNRESRIYQRFRESNLPEVSRIARIESAGGFKNRENRICPEFQESRESNLPEVSRIARIESAGGFKNRICRRFQESGESNLPRVSRIAKIESAGMSIVRPFKFSRCKSYQQLLKQYYIPRLGNSAPPPPASTGNCLK
jgi:hypothetical protein